MANIQTGELLCEEYGLMNIVGTKYESDRVDSGVSYVRMCRLGDHTRVYVRLHMPTFIAANTEL